MGVLGILGPVLGAEYFTFRLGSPSTCSLYSSSSRACAGVSGPRGELVAECADSASTTTATTTTTTISTTPTASTTTTINFSEQGKNLSYTKLVFYFCTDLEVELRFLSIAKMLI